MGFIDLIAAWQMQYEALQANGIYLFADAKQVRLQNLQQAAGSAVKRIGSFSGKQVGGSRAETSLRPKLCSVRSPRFSLCITACQQQPLFKDIQGDILSIAAARVPVSVQQMQHLSSKTDMQHPDASAHVALLDIRLHPCALIQPPGTVPHSNDSPQLQCTASPTSEQICIPQRPNFTAVLLAGHYGRHTLHPRGQ